MRSWRELARAADLHDQAIQDHSHPGDLGQAGAPDMELATVAAERSPGAGNRAGRRQERAYLRLAASVIRAIPGRGQPYV